MRFHNVVTLDFHLADVGTDSVVVFGCGQPSRETQQLLQDVRPRQ